MSGFNSRLFCIVDCVVWCHTLTQSCTDRCVYKQGVCEYSKDNRAYSHNMIATAVLVLVAMYGAGTSATTLQCQTPAACRCTLPVTGEIDEHWHEQCNMCSILGISTDCPAETQWDPLSFQIGFWAPHSADVTAGTVAVVKIVAPGTDVENPHLVVRGFNTPTLQGCGRSTYPIVADDQDWLLDPDSDLKMAKRDTWVIDSASWYWGENGVFTEPTTVCAPENRIWVFLVTVRASKTETNPANPVHLYFELKTATSLYVSYMKVPLTEMTMNAGTTSEFRTRSLYPIYMAKALPFVLVLLPKLFDIQFYPYPSTGSSPVPFAGAFTSNAISVPSGTTCIVQGVKNVVLALTLAEGCGGNTAVQHIAFGNSITVVATNQLCSFTLSEVCHPGWETSDAISCTRCLPGHFKAQADAGQCEPCPMATFMNHSGQTECYPCCSNQGVAQTTCVQCEPLQAAVPNAVPTQCQCSAGHTLSVAGVCEMCAYGKLKEVVSNAACTVCEAGKYGDTQGANAAASCKTCPSSDTSMQSSEPGSVDISGCLCTAGHQASNMANQCEKCNPGKAKTVAGNQECTLCNSTSIADGLGNLHCTACTAGALASFGNTACGPACESNAGLSASGGCVCNKGYTTATTAASCTQCVAGKYKGIAGDNACDSCVEGKYIANTGADSDICVFCESGSYPTLNNTATGCTTCPSGSGADSGSNYKIADCKCQPGHHGSDGAVCLRCLSGKFKTDHGSSACTSCVHGKYIDGVGSVADTCALCQSGSYPTLNIAATACTTCPSGSTTETGNNLNITGCKCPPGYEGNASAGVACSQCLAGKFKMDLGGSTGCVACASNSFASQPGAAECVVCGQGQAGAADRTTCVCAAEFGYDAATGVCTRCVDPFYKWEIGTVACRECVSPAIIDAMAKTCSDPADVDVTQEVILTAGKNYISFHVFKENTRVVDLFNQGAQEWSSASLFMKGVNGAQNFQTTDGATSFPFWSREHNKLNTYILNIVTSSTIPNLKLRYTGKKVQNLVDIKLVVSDDIWLPTLFASPFNNREVMPIRAACSATPCYQLTYQQDNKAIFFPSAVTNIMTSTVQAAGIWNQKAITNPGNVMRLSIKPHTTRPSGTGIMNAQIDKTLITLQHSTYLNTQSQVRSSGVAMITTSKMNPVTHCRLLAVAPQTLPEHCPTNEIAACECKMLDGSVLNWPLDDCNSCVQKGISGVCDNMGSDLNDAALTFYVRINPPTNVLINVDAATTVSNVIGVAKLKRSFPFQTGTTNGVQYEHINIRSYRYAYCAGCQSSAGGVESWGDTFCGGCDESNKLFLFSFPVQLSTAELKNDNDATALAVNFEFDIGGTLYVTDNSELARKRNANGLTGLTDVNTYLQKTFEIVPKRFEIICPRVYDLLHSAPASACPFEGTLPATILIRPSMVSQLSANAANYDKTDPEFRIRQTITDGVRSTAQSERFFYTIRSMPGIVTYVRVNVANFETCERQAVWKTSNGKTCDPDGASKLGVWLCGEDVKYVTRPLH